MSDTASTSTRKQNFFHNSINITTWMREKIENILKEKGFVMASLEIDSEVMARMSQVTVINNLNLEYKDGHEKVYFLTNYSSVSKTYDGDKKSRWLVEMIKEFEMEAVLKFGGRALGSEKNDDSNYTVENMDVSQAVKVNTETITMEISSNVTVDEMVLFLTKKEYMNRWMLGQGVFEGNGETFSSVKFDSLELGNYKVEDNTIRFTYKRNDWNEPSVVRIELIKTSNSTKMHLVQKNVPIEATELVKTHWREKIFMPISYAFSCVVQTI